MKNSKLDLIENMSSKYSLEDQKAKNAMLEALIRYENTIHESAKEKAYTEVVRVIFCGAMLLLVFGMLFGKL